MATDSIGAEALDKLLVTLQSLLPPIIDPVLPASVQVVPVRISDRLLRHYGNRLNRRRGIGQTSCNAAVIAATNNRSGPAGVGAGGTGADIHHRRRRSYRHQPESGWGDSGTARGGYRCGDGGGQG